MPFSYRSYKKKASSMSACIIARHRAIRRPGVGGVAGRQGGGLSEGQAGSGRQAAQRTPPPREGAYLFLAIAESVLFPRKSTDFFWNCGKSKIRAGTLCILEEL